MVILELLLLAASAIGYVLALKWLLADSLTPLMLFGFLWLLVIAVLAILFAAGQVHEESSFGLRELVIALASMGGSWGTAAFQHAKEKPNGIAHHDDTDV